MYEFGRDGIHMNPNTALHYYNKPYGFKSVMGTVNLGDLRMHGKFEEKDTEMELKYYQEAEEMFENDTDSSDNDEGLYIALGS